VSLWLLALALGPLLPEHRQCLGAPSAAFISQSRPTSHSHARNLASDTTADYRFPTTGAIFSLPEIDPDDVPESVHLPSTSERPAGPDLFRMKAVPVRSGPQVAKLWRAIDVDFGSDGPWTELLSEARRLGLEGPEATEMVNLWVNWHVRYRADAGVDVWSDARTTLEQKLGDCEDIAISKMALLKALGTPANSMFLVIARDDRKVDHAVLAVRQGDVIYILDNRTDIILRDVGSVGQYTPIMSVSEQFAWTYGLPR
jgi:predicted transglutaminase-like cysteine proteinase